MASQLSNLEIDEISLVDEPANESARVVIVKAKGGFKPCAGCESPAVCKKAGMCAEKAEDENEDEYGMKKSRTEPAGSAGDQSADARSNDGDHQMDIETLSKALETAEARLDDLQGRTETAETKLAEAEEMLKAKNAEIATLRKSAGVEEEEVLKSLPESIRKRLEANEAEIRKMREERETQEAVAKARGLGLNDPEKIGPVLARVTKSAKAEDAAALETLLKSLVAVGNANVLFRAIGSDQAVDGDPTEILKAKAEEIRKSRPTLSAEAAYAAAVDQNPALYNAYIAKRRG